MSIKDTINNIYDFYKGNLPRLWFLQNAWECKFFNSLLWKTIFLCYQCILVVILIEHSSDNFREGCTFSQLLNSCLYMLNIIVMFLSNFHRFWPIVAYEFSGFQVNPKLDWRWGTNPTHEVILKIRIRKLVEDEGDKTWIIQCFCIFFNFCR